MWYKDIEAFRPWDRLGTDQFVWCCTSNDGWPNKAGYVQWELDVPGEQLLGIVDCMVWAGIRGESPCPPPRLRAKLQLEAMERFADDDGAADRWYNEQVEKLLHPRGDPWDLLFLSDADDPRADVLLTHPVERGWVTSRQLFES